MSSLCRQHVRSWTAAPGRTIPAGPRRTAVCGTARTASSSSWTWTASSRRDQTVSPSRTRTAAVRPTTVRQSIQVGWDNSFGEYLTAAQFICKWRLAEPTVCWKLESLYGVSTPSSVPDAAWSKEESHNELYKLFMTCAHIWEYFKHAENFRLYAGADAGFLPGVGAQWWTGAWMLLNSAFWMVKLRLRGGRAPQRPPPGSAPAMSYLVEVGAWARNTLHKKTVQ